MLPQCHKLMALASDFLFFQTQQRNPDSSLWSVFGVDPLLKVSSKVMVTNDSKHIVKKISEKCFIKRSCEFYGLRYFSQHQQQPLLVLLVNIYASLCSGYFGFSFLVILPLPMLLSNFGSCILCLFYLFFFSCLVSICWVFPLSCMRSLVG